MFNLIWKESGNLVRQAGKDDQLVWAPSAPGVIGEPRIIEVSASGLNISERLEKVRLYVTGNPADVNTVMSVWPFLGRQPGQPRRDELNGGLEVSFDGGRTWQRFKYAAGNSDPDYPNYGYEADALGTDPARWATLPSVAIGLTASDGVLRNFDTGRFLLRWKIPAGANQFHIFAVTVEAAYDIV